MPDNTYNYQNPNNFTVNPNYEEGTFYRRSVPQFGTDEWNNAARAMYDNVRQSGGLQKYLQDKIYDYMNSDYSREDIIDSLKGLNERFAGDPTLGDDDRLSLDYINNYADYVENLRNGYTYEATDEDYENMEREKEERERKERERKERELETERQAREKERRENLDLHIQNEPNFDYSSDLQRMKVESERGPLTKRAERINNRASRISQEGQNMQDRMNNNDYIKDFRANTVGRKMDRANRKLDRVDKIMGYQDGGNVGSSQGEAKKIDGKIVLGKDALDRINAKVNEYRNRGIPMESKDSRASRPQYRPWVDTLRPGQPPRKPVLYQEGGEVSEQEQQIVGMVQAAMQGNKEAQQMIQQIMQAAQGGDEQAMQIAQYIQAIVQQMQGAAKHMNGGKFGYVHYLRTGRRIGEKVRYVRNGGRINMVNIVGKTVERPRINGRQRSYIKYW